MKQIFLFLFTVVSLSFNTNGQDSLVIVKDYNDFFFPTQDRSMVVLSSTQLLHAGQTAMFGNNIWQTDGTTPNTSVFLSTSNPISGYSPTAITTALGKIFFIHQINSTKYLYVSDGTSAGTIRLCKLGSSSNTNLYEGMINEPKVANNRLFFFADSSATGIELWSTDGTFNGTSMIKDIISGSSSSISNPRSTVLNDKFYFTANNITNGGELWVSDGTAANTEMVYDLHSGSTSTAFMNKMFVFNNNIYFTSTVSGYQYGLYKSDGIVGTSPTLVSDNLTLTSNTFVFNNKIYFGATVYIPTTAALYGDLYSISTNSTITLESDLTQTSPEVVNGMNYILGSAGDHIILSVSAQLSGIEPWSYNTLTSTANLLTDIRTGSANGLVIDNFSYETFFSNKISSIGNKLVFIAQSQENGVSSGNGSHQEEVWVTDGTSSGTGKALSKLVLTNYQDYAFYSMKNFNGDVYMYGCFYNAGSSVAKLWKLRLGVTTNTLSKKSIDFNLYPNPTNDYFQFTNVPLGSDVRITDINGKIVFTKKYTSIDDKIITSNFIKGIYFVTIENEDTLSTKKLIIE
ncbi:MAG: T9SS type A sorting domain-containing protein [Cytophagaceae bacterium]